MWRAENSEATWDSALGSLYVRFGRWEGELRSVGSMRGRYQIHVPISDFFRISSRPRVLDWSVRRFWRRVAPSVLNDLWLAETKKQSPATFFLHPVGKTQSDQENWANRRVFGGRNLALRLLVTLSAASLSRLPWWVLYLSPFIAYRWPHSSISHNSAARQESRGPLHSSVIFHSSSLRYSSSQDLRFYCKYPSRLSTRSVCAPAGYPPAPAQGMLCVNAVRVLSFVGLKKCCGRIGAARHSSRWLEFSSPIFPCRCAFLFSKKENIYLKKNRFRNTHFDVCVCACVCNSLSSTVTRAEPGKEGRVGTAHCARNGQSARSVRTWKQEA